VSGTKSSASHCQPLQLILHQWEGLGGPQSEPLGGGGLEVTALGINGLSSRCCRLLVDAMEGVLGSPQ